MPNWDNDEDFDPTWNRHETEVNRKRKLYGTRVEQQKLWNGKPVKEMESDHIMNALLFCEKRYSDAKRAFADCFDNSTFYFETIFEMFPDYANLRDEWFKRVKE